MKKIFLLSAVFVIALFVQTGFAQSEKELVIKTARAFETDPLGEETTKMAEKSMKWIDETKDLTVGLCSGTVVLFMDKKYKNQDELLSAYTFGMAAFKLENPTKASDEMAAQLAGVETVLKTYEAILKAKPKSKSDTLDKLLSKRNKGELSSLVTSIDCSKRL